MHLAGATGSLYEKPVGIALPRIGTAICGFRRGSSFAAAEGVWRLADSMQDAAYRITDADVDYILADRAHLRAIVVWSLRAPRTPNGQYDTAHAK